jgi:hypothetical protein
MGSIKRCVYRFQQIGLVAGLLVGCATVPEHPGEVTSRFSDDNVLKGTDLAKFAGKGSLMEAIERARPLWLSARGGATPMVLVDGAPATELSVLRGIQASDVEEAHLDRPTTSVGHLAIAPNGGAVDGPMIIVKTRRGRSGVIMNIYKC